MFHSYYARKVPKCPIWNRMYLYCDERRDIQWNIVWARRRSWGQSQKDLQRDQALFHRISRLNIIINIKLFINWEWSIIWRLVYFHIDNSNRVSLLCDGYHDITLRREECTKGAVNRLLSCMNLPVHLNKFRCRESLVPLLIRWVGSLVTRLFILI